MQDTNHSSVAGGFQEVEHTADWAYQVWGETLSELFTQATRGLYYLAGLECAPEPKREGEIRLQGIDAESLLIAWLNELLHFHESENVGIKDLEFLEVGEKSLHAKITLVPVEQWIKDIKAATYHNLAITPTARGLEATIVLDV